MVRMQQSTVPRARSPTDSFANPELLNRRLVNEQANERMSSVDNEKNQKGPSILRDSLRPASHIHPARKGPSALSLTPRAAAAAAGSAGSPSSDTVRCCLREAPQDCRSAPGHRLAISLTNK